MLRRFHTAVLEKNETCGQDFDTEPMECGWAGEATWFLRVAELDPGTTFRVQAQVSPDGLGWCDKDGAALAIPGPGLYQLEVRHFGGWLRLSCAVRGDAPRVKLTIYLALKGIGQDAVGERLIDGVDLHAHPAGDQGAQDGADAAGAQIEGQVGARHWNRSGSRVP